MQQDKDGMIGNLRDHDSVNNFKAFLKMIAKKWVFQLEKAPTTGRLHWQGRVSLKEKKRMLTLANEFKSNGWPGVHLSVELDFGASTMYCMKDDTREDGPWSDELEGIYRNPRYNPDTWKPEQQFILDRLEQQDERTILWIVNRSGRVGKTVLCEYLRQWSKYKAERVPRLETAEEISMAMFCMYETKLESGWKKSEPATFVVDIPRAMSARGMTQICASMETAKDGYLWEKRYKFRSLTIPPPRVVIFSNRLPNMNDLSLDRWDLFNWTPDGIWPLDAAELLNKQREFLASLKKKKTADERMQEAMAEVMDEMIEEQREQQSQQDEMQEIPETPQQEVSEEPSGETVQSESEVSDDEDDLSEYERLQRDFVTQEDDSSSDDDEPETKKPCVVPYSLLEDAEMTRAMNTQQQNEFIDECSE